PAPELRRTLRGVGERPAPHRVVLEREHDRLRDCIAVGVGCHAWVERHASQPSVRAVSSIYWFHSIDLGDRVTPGQQPPELLTHEWDQMRLPPLAGKTVLAIGAWAGYSSFRAADARAARG